MVIINYSIIIVSIITITTPFFSLLQVDVDMDSVPQEELDRLDERLGALLAEYRGQHPTRKKKKKRRKGGLESNDSDVPQLSAEEQSLMHFQTR